MKSVYFVKCLSLNNYLKSKDLISNDVQNFGFAKG